MRLNRICTYNTYILRSSVICVVHSRACCTCHIIAPQMSSRRVLDESRGAQRAWFGFGFGHVVVVALMCNEAALHSARRESHAYSRNI